METKAQRRRFCGICYIPDVEFKNGTQTVGVSYHTLIPCIMRKLIRLTAANSSLSVTNALHLMPVHWYSVFRPGDEIIKRCDELSLWLVTQYFDSTVDDNFWSSVQNSYHPPRNAGLHSRLLEANQEPKMKMARVSTDLFIISLLATISAVAGCGVMPAGQARTRPFTVRGFSLPVAMVYAGFTEVSAQVSGIARDIGGARAFVQRLVIQTVFDVLEDQARSALPT
ncbi:hypothetical protein KIN20_012031 [Parelaphostrongylus tenuis]|uniref:Uncharacterized protein n=1 Tax=Parelaphostrongylus tenuis TaxID=148309 RepID=A0AAD5MW97_PARTN|nr:hypothetical protein KIN20_012031 [Parelaphostrongylus tenuis]